MTDSVKLPVVGADVPDHVAAALGRLLEQDKNKTGITSMVTSVVTPVQDLESALWQLLTQRRIDTAVGTTLDALGKLVNQQRLGFQDDDYRRLIKARILVNASRGRPEDLLAIAKLVVNNTATTDMLPMRNIATAPTRVLGDRVEWSTASIAISMLRDAVAAGVRPIMEFETWPTVTLTKTTGAAVTFDASASSSEKIAGDGWVQSTVVETNKIRAFGLSATTALQYSWFLDSGGAALYAYEFGVVKLTTTYAAGDVLSVRRIGSTIYYVKNGVTLYTSTVPVTTQLLVEAACADLNATLSDVRLYDAGIRKQITWTVIANLSISPAPPNSTYANRARFADASVFNGSAFCPQNVTDVKNALGGFGTWTGGAGWKFDALSGNISALFGSPALTAVSSPLFGNPGPRGGTDKAVGFNSASDAFDGGNNFDLGATSDLIVAWVCKVTTNPAGSRGWFSKSAGVAGYYAYRTSTGFLRLNINNALDATTTAAIPTGEWLGCIGVIDRVTQRMQLGVIGLTSGTSVVSAAIDISGQGSPSNAASLAFGNGIVTVDTDLQYAAGYINSGVGISSGLQANLSTALTAFRNYLTRVPTGYTALPNYGNGADDQLDKYPRCAEAVVVALGNRGSFASGAGYLCNEASGNLASAFGSPATLTASGTPSYNKEGARSGRDTGVAFTTTADNFAGGTGDFDIATSSTDLIVSWVARFSTAPNGTNFLGKGIGVVGYWLVTSATGISLIATNGSSYQTAEVSAQVGVYHAGIAVIDRSTGKMRIATQDLRNGTQSISAEVTIGAVAFTNANAWKVGNWGGGGTANTNVTYAGLYPAVGVGIATGLSANLASALSSFAAQINRYYGGPISAAME